MIRVHGGRRLAALLLLLAPAMPARTGAAARPVTPRPAPAAATRPTSGGAETVVEIHPLAGSRVGEGVARRTLDRPPERVVRAVADWSHYAEFFPFVRRSTAKRMATGRVRVTQEVDLPFPYADRRLDAVATSCVEDSPQGRVWRVAWHRIAAQGVAPAFADHHGEWTLRAAPGGRTLVELRLVSDAGEAVPAVLQRRALERALPWVLDGLRQQVERCRYDLPRAASCAEEPALAALGPSPERPACAASASTAGSPD